MKLFCPTIIFLLLSVYVQLNGQGTDNDYVNLLRKTNVVHLTNSDFVSIYTNLQGTKYYPSYNNETEIPYFCNSHLLTGSVLINHFTLEDLPLIYDIYIDELIFSSNIGLFKLRKEMVEKFSLYDLKNLKHDFVNFSFTIDNSKVQNGYFEVIYNDKNTIYVKRQKELGSKLKPNTIEYYYMPSDKYFLYHSGHYYYIKNLRSLLKILNKDELKSFIKSKKFSKRKLIEKQILDTITYFDSL